MNSEMEIPWMTPSKRKGENMIYPGTPRNELFHKVLKDQAAEETRRWDKTISPETMLITFALKPSTYTKVIGARMKERYNQLKKERNNGTTYMDIKKPTHR